MSMAVSISVVVFTQLAWFCLDGRELVTPYESEQQARR